VAESDVEQQLHLLVAQGVTRILVNDQVNLRHQFSVGFNDS